MATTSAPRPPTDAFETLSVPVEDLTEARIRMSFGGGDLTVHQAAPGVLLSGTFDEGARLLTGGKGRLELEPRNPAAPLLTLAPVRWDVGLTGEIPVDLRLDTGANRSRINLEGLRVRRLQLNTGASETRLRMPNSGQTEAEIDCGFASVTVEVPPGVAGRIRGSMGLGALEVDPARFPRRDDGWESPDYDTATNRVEITVSGGLGSVRVI
jgi:hypothetical protein